MIIGHKHITEAVDFIVIWTGRGAFYGRRRCTLRYAGAHRKANVGMSNDNAGEKPAHRKTKVS